jgi:hypothetical protein
MCMHRQAIYIHCHIYGQFTYTVMYTLTGAKQVGVKAAIFEYIISIVYVDVGMHIGMYVVLCAYRYVCVWYCMHIGMYVCGTVCI